MKARLNPRRTGQAVAGLAWGLVAAISVDLVAVIILFGVGP